MHVPNPRIGKQRAPACACVGLFAWLWPRYPRVCADGKLDLAGIVERLKSQGLTMLVESSLGDGENNAISLDAVRNLFGGEKVQAFVGAVGVGEPEATQGLADAVPHLLDKASSGGSLMDAFGGASGALGALGKLFRGHALSQPSTDKVILIGADVGLKVLGAILLSIVQRSQLEPLGCSIAPAG
jgi:hypothetical protein